MEIRSKALFFLFWIGILQALSACQPFSTAELQNNPVSKIRYEGVDENGHFVTKSEFENTKQSAPSKDELLKLQLAGAASTHLLQKSVDDNSSNKIHIVFIGDGYRADELDQFAIDVENNKNIFLQQQPFKAYSKHFVFHRLDIASSVSLSRLDPQQILSAQDTAFGMHYGCHGIDRLLCIDTARVLAATKSIPKVHAIFALANSDRYGGAGYSNPAMATLSARNPAASELALHEFGHSFGGLTDEYETSGPTTNCSLFANSSSLEKAKMLADQSKWYRWLDLPHVGTFQGSCYGTSFYRPTANSKMRSLGNSYEEVNVEQFIFQFYQKISPLNSWSPNNQKTLKGHQVLQVSTLDPQETPLKIQWKVNGQVISSFDQMKQVHTDRMNLKKGTYVFQVLVLDPTLRVRDEKFRSEKMSKSITWKIKIL